MYSCTCGSNVPAPGLHATIVIVEDPLQTLDVGLGHLLADAVIDLLAELLTVVVTLKEGVKGHDGRKKGNSVCEREKEKERIHRQKKQQSI